jgi:hypothetical protein
MRFRLSKYPPILLGISFFIVDAANRLQFYTNMYKMVNVTYPSDIEGSFANFFKLTHYLNIIVLEIRTII